MKLKKQDQDKLDLIIGKYKKIYKIIESKQEKMKLLQREVNILVNELSLIRSNENEFGKYLEKNYGKGRFNIISREYELDK